MGAHATSTADQMAGGGFERRSYGQPSKSLATTNMGMGESTFFAEINTIQN